jgi:2-hydroxychromene-2-carboxylate isomerase
MADAYRWAETWGVPFRWPSRFPMRTLLPLRVALAAGDAHVPFTHAAYRAYWAEDRDISDEREVRALAEVAGLPPDVLARANDADVKDRLKANTEEAAARGACGAPSFFVTPPGGGGPFYFWGQDRLVLVERVLGGWRPRSG